MTLDVDEIRRGKAAKNKWPWLYRGDPELRQTPVDHWFERELAVAIVREIASMPEPSYGVGEQAAQFRRIWRASRAVTE